MNQASQIERTLIDVSIESLRLVRAFEKLLANLDDREAQRYLSRISYFCKSLSQGLDEAGLSLIHPTPGDFYDPGMAVTAVNLADFQPEDALVIDVTLEPIVMGCDGTIKRTGSVTVRKAHT